jgi:hypothetical protein
MSLGAVHAGVAHAPRARATTPTRRASALLDAASDRDLGFSCCFSSPGVHAWEGFAGCHRFRADRTQPGRERPGQGKNRSSRTTCRPLTKIQTEGQDNQESAPDDIFVAPTKREVRRVLFEPRPSQSVPSPWPPSGLFKNQVSFRADSLPNSLGRQGSSRAISAGALSSRGTRTIPERKGRARGRTSFPIRDYRETRERCSDKSQEIVGWPQRRQGHSGSGDVASLLPPGARRHQSESADCQHEFSRELLGPTSLSTRTCRTSEAHGNRRGLGGFSLK